MALSKEDQEQKRLALAHRLLDTIQKIEWREVVVPFYEAERLLLIELMSGLTDPMQLMRYAGAVQDMSKIIDLEPHLRQIVKEAQDRKLSKFN